MYSATKKTKGVNSSNSRIPKLSMEAKERTPLDQATTRLLNKRRESQGPSYNGRLPMKFLRRSNL